MSCSLTLKSSRLVDLWVIPYCLPYCYAAGTVYSPVVCMVRELGSFCIALGLVHPLANCKLLATPAHRLCAEIHVRALLNLERYRFHREKSKSSLTSLIAGLTKHFVGLANDLLAGRLGFEPRQTASKAVDLPLVDRPVLPARLWPGKLLCEHRIPIVSAWQGFG